MRRMEEKAAILAENNIAAMIIFASAVSSARSCCASESGRLLMVLAVLADCSRPGRSDSRIFWGSTVLSAFREHVADVTDNLRNCAEGLGDDAKFGPRDDHGNSPVHSSASPAMIIDRGMLFRNAAVNLSFTLPLICFLVIIAYGYRTRNLV